MRPLALAALGLCACGPAPRELVLRDWPARAELNARLTLTADASLDPASVTPSSVRVETPEGRSLQAELGVERGALVVELVLDPELLAAPPPSLLLRLAGEPSPHALMALDGRRLPRGQVLAVVLEPRLASSRAQAPRLERAQGQPPPFSGLLKVEEALQLDFEGVLDPASVAPASCPLFPVQEGLLLEPVLPQVRWSCTGERTRLELVPPAGAGRWTLPLRRWAVTDLTGRAPDPPLALELERG